MNFSLELVGANFGNFPYIDFREFLGKKLAYFGHKIHNFSSYGLFFGLVCPNYGFFSENSSKIGINLKIVRKKCVFVTKL